jgi:esterase/lipase superfamily enzyme
MHREHQRWFSPSLSRDMELLVFGHAGARVVVFPTSMGRFFDWEGRGLVGQTLGEQLNRGWIQLFCVDSVDNESWYCEGRPMADRARRHAQFDDYVFREVLPFSAAKNANPYLIVTGASFGGYHAVNFGLRHPDKVNRILSMSGLCDIRRFTNGYYDETIYFHNPVDFIANEHDATRIDMLKRQDIILAVGREDSLCGSNEQLSRVLWSRGIGNALRVWDGFAHDWPVWDRMLRLYLAGHD